MPRQYTPRVALSCDTCDRVFSVVAGRATIARFCSHSCYVASITVPVADRFWPKVQKSDGCWEWIAAHLPSGYGVVGVGGSQGGCVRAHRYAWTLATGQPVPPGFNVLHACDNPPCVRNDEPGIYVIRGIVRPRFGHLWLGTDLDNMIDKSEKGRARFRQGHTDASILRGEQHANAKATDAIVRKIKARYAQGDISYATLAAEYGFSPGGVAHIIRGERWKHVT